MDTHIIDKIRSQVASDIRLTPVNGHLRIGTPLVFDDGDRCGLYLMENNEGWALTDLGDTLIRAGYQEANLLDSGYRDRFERLLAFFGMREESGEIVMPIHNERFADSIFSFAQGAVELVRLASAPAEKERKTEKRFQEAFSHLVKSLIPVERLEENWHHSQFDPDKIYRVDYRVRGTKDDWWYLFGVSTIPKCLHAALTCYHYSIKGVHFKGLAIYKDKESLKKRNTSPLDDVIGKSFSVDTEKEALQEYIHSQGLAV